jgi:hypothetical protein
MIEISHGSYCSCGVTAEGDIIKLRNCKFRRAGRALLLRRERL